MMKVKFTPGLKAQCYTAIVWAALIVFGVIGALKHRPIGTVIVVITCICWVTLSIIRDAVVASAVLMTADDDDEEVHETKEPPPGPPSGMA